MEYKLVFVLIPGLWSVNTVWGAYDVNTASLLHTSLTFGYNKDLRPSDTVNVSVTLTLDSINFLDFEQKTFSSKGWITSIWKDSRLNWDKTSNGDIEYMFLTKANCWTPTLIIDNERSNKGVLNDDNLPMRVQHNDTITWEQPLAVNVFCDLDSALFPFDRQTCSISIGTAGYDQTTIVLFHGRTDVVTTKLQENADWTLEQTSLSTSDRTDGSGLYSYTYLIFNFELRRNGAWYVSNIIVPLVVTSILGLAVFLIPVENSEKMLFTSSVFVVNAIFCWISASVIPSSSKSTPVLGTCMASILFLNGMEMVLTVMTIRIYNRLNRTDRTVPLTTQAIVKKFKRTLECRFGVEDGQTKEILDLTKSDNKKSNTLKSKFSVKSQNKVGPSPSPVTTGYQRMQSGADSSPSVDPDVDGRTNLPSNSRYRPSSFTMIRPTSQAQERPSSYTPGGRPASWKSVACIQIRERSFVNDDLITNYTPVMNNFVTNEPENSAQETITNDVISETVAGNATLEKKASEKSTKQVPSKATSFRSNRGKDENEITWLDVSRFFDLVCFVIFVIVKLVLFVVPCALFIMN